MFRQAVVLAACLIALAVASDDIWFELGFRVEGDQNLVNQTTRSFLTESAQRHSINLLFIGGENTFTHSRFDIEGVSFRFLVFLISNFL